jgi:heat-inducible transcriptional repressor
MLDERKAAILRAVVEEYIDTAQPVGSGHVARSPSVNVSSATVRNDMATLEHEGYLSQPHTSAGRIPTEKGYRFFVDSLSTPTALRGSKAEQVRSFFDHAHGEVEQMLNDTSRLLSNLTSCAGVVLSAGHDEATVRSVQVVPIATTAALVIVVLSNGVVEKHAIDLPVDTGDERVGAASAHLTAHLSGSMRSTLAPLPSTGDALADEVTRIALVALEADHGGDPDQVFVGGTSLVAQAFDAIETVRQVLGILEQQYVVVTLLRDVIDRGLHVAIGTETGMAPLAECALVVAPYHVEGEKAGTIGVLGPTRMDYQQALAAVAVVSSRLSNRLTEG